MRKPLVTATCSVAVLSLLLAACSSGATDATPTAAPDTSAADSSRPAAVPASPSPTLSATEPNQSPVAYPHTGPVSDGYSKYVLGSWETAPAEIARLTGGVCQAATAPKTGHVDTVSTCSLPEGDSASIVWSTENMDEDDYSYSILMRGTEDDYFVAGANWLVRSKDKAAIKKIADAYGAIVNTVPREYRFETLKELRDAYKKASGDECANWTDFGPYLVEGKGVNGRGACGAKLAMAVFTDGTSQSGVLRANDGKFNSANPGPFYVAGPDWYIAQEGSRSKPSAELRKVAKALNEEVLQFGVDEVYSR